VYAHAPDILGEDGKKLSKRHGAQSVEDFRNAGYLPETLVNFLALLGWAPDGETTIMSRKELVERFSLERVGASPATFDYKKLDWMNGQYIRSLTPDEFADRLVTYVRERGFDWPEERIRAAAPLVQEKISTLGEFPDFARFLFEDVSANGEPVDHWDAGSIEQALRGMAERLDLSPRKAFQPVRIAVTGSKVSPGLFESLELLGKDVSLSRLRAR
jgi:glutamyl-tRNA synthetase